MSIVADYETYVSTDTWGKFCGARELLKLMDEAGIDVAIVMAEAYYRPNNELTYREIKGHNRLIGCATINANFGEEAVQELEKAVNTWGMKGLKLMPTFHGYRVDSPLVYPLMEKVREFGIPVTIHSGSYYAQPLEIGALAEIFPDVPIIMDHMGYRYNVNQAVQMAKKHDNIYLGTAVVVVEPVLIKIAVEEAGAEKIIFGSNAPGSFMDLSIESIKRIGFSKEQESLIFGENLARLYDITHLAKSTFEL